MPALPAVAAFILAALLVLIIPRLRHVIAGLLARGPVRPCASLAVYIGLGLSTALADRR